MEDARQKLAKFRKHYNEQRPHSALADRTPADFAALHRGKTSHLLGRAVQSLLVESLDCAKPTSNQVNRTVVRDRLCQIIRQHKLDPELVKAYAVDFCGTKTLRDATREQVENSVQSLADWAEKDRNALPTQQLHAGPEGRERRCRVKRRFQGLNAAGHILQEDITVT